MIGQITHEWAQKIHLHSFYLNSVPSTNTYAKELTSIPNQRFIILTDQQTHGRGRNTNTWTQEQNGDVLLSSWCFLLDRFPKATLTCRIGLILYESLKKYWPELDWSIKAPNDLYLDQKKVAGILVELIQNEKGYLLIIGIGLNVLSAPTSVAKSTALFEINQTTFNKDQWFQFLSHFYHQLQLTVLSADSFLSPQECEKLLIALNEFPLLAEKYIQIEENGTLKTKTKTVLWSEL